MWPARRSGRSFGASVGRGSILGSDLEDVGREQHELPDDVLEVVPDEAHLDGLAHRHGLHRDVGAREVGRGEAAADEHADQGRDEDHVVDGLPELLEARAVAGVRVEALRLLRLHGELAHRADLLEDLHGAGRGALRDLPLALADLVHELDDEVLRDGDHRHRDEDHEEELTLQGEDDVDVGNQHEDVVDHGHGDVEELAGEELGVVVEPLLQDPRGEDVEEGHVLPQHAAHDLRAHLQPELGGDLVDDGARGEVREDAEEEDDVVRGAHAPELRQRHGAGVDAVEDRGHAVPGHGAEAGVEDHEHHGEAVEGQERQHHRGEHPDALALLHLELPLRLARRPQELRRDEGAAEAPPDLLRAELQELRELGAVEELGHELQLIPVELHGGPLLGLAREPRVAHGVAQVLGDALPEERQGAPVGLLLGLDAEVRGVAVLDVVVEHLEEVPRRRRPPLLAALAVALPLALGIAVLLVPPQRLRHLRQDQALLHFPHSGGLFRVLAAEEDALDREGEARAQQEPQRGAPPGRRPDGGQPRGVHGVWLPGLRAVAGELPQHRGNRDCRQ